jgi:hypothetical protein
VQIAFHLAAVVYMRPYAQVVALFSHFTLKKADTRLLCDRFDYFPIPGPKPPAVFTKNPLKLVILKLTSQRVGIDIRNSYSAFPYPRTAFAGAGTHDCTC